MLPTFLAMSLVASTVAAADLPPVDQLPSQPGLPDPLKMLDGTAVTTPQQWREQRRPVSAVWAGRAHQRARDQRPQPGAHRRRQPVERGFFPWPRRASRRATWCSTGALRMAVLAGCVRCHAGRRTATIARAAESLAAGRRPSCAML